MTELREPGGDRWRNPDPCWPADRAWFLATDVDFWSLDVGGSCDSVDDLTDAGTTAVEVDGKRLNSLLWALVKRATERGAELHTTHPVLAQVWRDPARQANLACAIRNFDVHAFDESVSVGRRARGDWHLRRHRRPPRRGGRAAVQVHPHQ